MKNVFRKVAHTISLGTGNAITFLCAILIVIIWALTGPVFGFSDTWQLVINTGTTVITFLMVFLIQNTQNRDSKAVQLKLDELIHATKGARGSFVNLEDLSDEDLHELDLQFKNLVKNPATARALARLHNHIESEHVRRLGFPGLASAIRQHSSKLHSPEDHHE